jgi:hypothetical protein
MPNLLNEINNALKRMVNDDDFMEYLSRPIANGKYYILGDAQDLMELTSDISSDDISEFISEKNLPVTMDLFVLRYNLGLSKSGIEQGATDCNLIVLCHKISPNFLLIIGFIGVEGFDPGVALNPCFSIIPLGLHGLDPSSEDFIVDLLEEMNDDGVDPNFLGFLDNIDFVFSDGDITFFYVADNEGSSKEETREKAENIADEMKIGMIDIVYRFLLAKATGTEVKVTPNTLIDTGCKRALPKIPREFYLLKAPDSDMYLGYSD